ncbi:hypothetical protein OG883_41550 [Streptomyces sp. NBC_01142]|uniref:hypothetical protein n=1 Tax=Streptomyces sp. NBC_01142 TaxID=2975865 RepID=UPI002252FD47|nr:hypothetical protein [Streptomyces sp. NBC_01142]MCX4826159.1 hypothetical protein [Streptomyces sp. NBC_01142]
MSRQAIAYVHQTGIADETAKQVFLLLAQRTETAGDPHRPEDIPDIMSLNLNDSDIPASPPTPDSSPKSSADSCEG